MEDEEGLDGEFMSPGYASPCEEGEEEMEVEERGEAEARVTSGGEEAEESEVGRAFMPHAHACMHAIGCPGYPPRMPC
jgi:hypothetical protein